MRFRAVRPICREIFLSEGTVFRVARNVANARFPRTGGRRGSPGPMNGTMETLGPGRVLLLCGGPVAGLGRCRHRTVAPVPELARLPRACDDACLPRVPRPAREKGGARPRITSSRKFQALHLDPLFGGGFTQEFPASSEGTEKGRRPKKRGCDAQRSRSQARKTSG